MSLKITIRNLISLQRKVTQKIRVPFKINWSKMGLMIKIVVHQG